MKQLITSLITLFISFTHLTATAQIALKGRVTDYTSGAGIEQVAIQSNQQNKGTITDQNGYFSILIEKGNQILTFTHLSYRPFSIGVTAGDKNEFLNIQLTPDMIGLDEISIISSHARERNTPVAISTIKTALIQREIGGQEYPEIMKMTPGVYATKLGGGNGDARISIRGFQQENLGLLLNGVPVSSVENGLVYWSNWAGLGDATQSIQVQRGLGASRVALNSVGGTINIVTKTTEASKGGSISHAISDFGNRKTILSLSTGKTDNGYALTFLGSRTTGPGYVDATHVDAWAWFLSLSKQINSKHLLVFTGMGAPERHGQRTYGLTKQQYDQYGNRYNPNWGMFNGKIESLSENFYHKPQLALNHYWKINDKSLLASSAYLSFGDGGGKFSESFMSEGASGFRKNNQIDWDAVYRQNTNNSDSVQLAGGEYVKGFSKIILTNYRASHVWYGLLSTLNHEVNDNFKIITGIHTRYFKSNLREEISNLLGGNFWVDQYAWSLAGIGGRNQIKGVGDIINVDNDARVDVVSYFGQAEYRIGKVNAFAAGTVSNTWFRRADRINYIGNTESELVSKAGYDLKAGLDYNIDNHHNFYLNAGYYSKAPYFKFVFANFSNAVVQDLGNEIIEAFEAGYDFNRGNINLKFNAYYTLWKDKSLLSRENIQLENNTQTRALIRGLDAMHKGLEFEGTAKLSRNLMLGSVLSLGDWRWKNDVQAELYNDNQVLIDYTEVYAKDLKVGDAPQFQAGIYGELILLPDLTLNFNWLYHGRLYAEFDPAGRNNPDDRKQPYRIPDYSITDLFVNYDFKIAGLKTIASVSCYNLLDKEAIMRGEDGSTHDIDSFRGFWSQGRTFNLSMKISF
ncbi:Vitamin B12 transporter BtuB [anaerobic digester metagenome]